MSRFSSWFEVVRLRLPIAIRATMQFLRSIDSVVQTAALFVFVVILLQWLLSASLFWEIVTTSGFTFLEFIEFFARSFIRVFTLADDLTPLSFIGIAFFQAVALRMLIDVRRSDLFSSSFSSLAAGLFGSGCVACGGSVLTPLLSVAATGISVSFAEFVGDLMLVGALVLSMRSWLMIASRYAAAYPPGIKGSGRV